MLTMLSLKKSLIVEQFQGNYLNLVKSLRKDDALGAFFAADGNWFQMRDHIKTDHAFLSGYIKNFFFKIIDCFAIVWVSNSCLKYKRRFYQNVKIIGDNNSNESLLCKSYSIP